MQISLLTSVHKYFVKDALTAPIAATTGLDLRLDLHDYLAFLALLSAPRAAATGLDLRLDLHDYLAFLALGCHP